jgi:hypothetical protein
MARALTFAGSMFVIVLAVALAPGSAGGVVVDPCVPEGNGGNGWCGDGGPATQARLANPRGVAETSAGGLLIADTHNNIVRRISPAGIITRIAGIGLRGHTGDGGPATAARLDTPECVAEEPDGSVLVRESMGLGYVVRRIFRGTITTVAGPDPCRPAVLPDGSTLVVDRYANQVNRVGADGASTVVAGTGACASSGDGGLATMAALAHPSGVAVLAGGGFVIADDENNLIRRVDSAGIIETVAGRDPPLALACGASGENEPPNYLVLGRPLAARAARPLKITITSTNAGRLTLTIARGRPSARGPRVFGPLRRRAREGRLLLTIRPRLRSGTYTLTVTNRGTRIGIDEQQERFRKTDRDTLTITR